MNENGQKSPSEFEAARNRLRDCWELASVFNFLKVFAPIIGSELKMSAEEIESSLILPDRYLRLIHIVLLKGIPPVSKNLKEPDAWVVILSKKLFMWWPWVAKGDFPLTAAKGAEMETYKNLDPTVRLVILKALCEIRADQHDVIAYVNDAVRVKNEISSFRKTNIANDGKGTSYWLDGNETIGLRLYKEVNTLKKNVTPPTVSCQWETLATNLEEFQKVVAEYSSSGSKLEAAVSATVENEAIPVLNKIYKKKQRQLQKKMNEERILNSFSRSGITRSCRNRTPITYTFDEYDKVISDAIRDSKRLKTKDEEKNEKKENLAKEDPQQAGEGESTGSEDNDVCEDSGEESEKNISEEPDENDIVKDSGEESDADEVCEDSDEVSGSDEDVSEDAGEESDEDDKENMNIDSRNDGKRKSRNQRVVRKETIESEEDGESTQSESDSDSSESETKDISENEDDNKENKNNIRIKENGNHSIQKMDHFGTKKRLVQRPNRNTAIESAIVPDSEDEISSDESDN